MKYYIFGPGDDINNLSEDNELGEVDLKGTFWCYTGYKALMNIVNNIERYENIIDDITIIDDKKKQYSIESFLELLTKYKLKTK